MITFDEDIHDDVKHGYLIAWAETPEGRVRCRASYALIEDLLGVSGGDQVREHADEAFEQLKPLFRHKIRQRDFARCDIKTVTVANLDAMQWTGATAGVAAAPRQQKGP